MFGTGVQVTQNTHVIGDLNNDIHPIFRPTKLHEQI